MLFFSSGGGNSLHGVAATRFFINDGLAQIVCDAAVDLSPAELGVIIEFHVHGSDT